MIVNFSCIILRSLGADSIKNDLFSVGLSDEDIKKISQIYIVACGSAYHVGVVAQYVLEDLAKLPVRVDVASEFRYRKPLLKSDDLVIVISQSDETADSLAALRLAKDMGVKPLAIVNVIGTLTQSALYEKTVSNMVECKSRGAYLMGLTTYGNYETEENADFTVYIPKTEPHFAASLEVIPLQLLGYYVSVAKGLDVDKPRNLAKSVTVE